MNLLTIIPEEVIEGNVLPYLKWNDLLRFRRVCKTLKDLTEAYMRIHPELAPWIEINEGEKSFRKFLEMGIPTTKISLNNGLSGNEFYEKGEEDVSKFLEKYGPLVKHLRVGQFTLQLHGKEWDFLDALVNLKEFQADFYGFGRISSNPEEQEEIRRKLLQNAHSDPRRHVHHLPSVFKQLKSVVIGQSEHFQSTRMINFTRAFLMLCVELEHVSLPFNPDWTPAPEEIPGPDLLDPGFVLSIALTLVLTCIEDRATEYPEDSNPKSFDFINYHNMDKFQLIDLDLLRLGSESFLEICTVSAKHNVKLFNVDPRWFRTLDPDHDSPDHGIPIVSLIGLNLYLFSLNMPNLERIVIRATSSTNIGPDWRQERPDWPALKQLEITVDSKITKTAVHLDNRYGRAILPQQRTSALLQFFFQDVQRAALSELRLQFSNNDGGVAVPKTEEIVAACPNLKKLALVNWLGTNKALTVLWCGLPSLEEISLECCKELGNVAFVGENKNDPILLKLTKLRKLTLRSLDNMPKITDTLFSLVLRHMKLSHLTLTSATPLISVTSTGILSLLEGKFTKSIEKFPFQSWSLAGVSPEEFGKMETKFRSYNML